MSQVGRDRVVWFFILVLGLIVLGQLGYVVKSFAHDDDHEHDQWYATLKQPDAPLVSCCGLSDAYWCDDYFARGGEAFCRITDDRVIMGRPVVPVGTEIKIPPHKLKWDKGNPTGHAIVFMGSSRMVYCFVQSSGI